ncbi:MAG: HAMP domain-containing sensor histidine kinase, partial [bacterium]
QKLVIAFFVSTLAAGALVLISYYNLARVEDKIHMVEAADDFSNIILEIRRYEKNYFLYSRKSDSEETFHFIEQAFHMLEVINPSIEKLKLGSRIKEISTELQNYRSLFEQIICPFDCNSLQKGPLMTELRDSGQVLVHLSKSLVAHERHQILQINNRLKNNIFIFLILFACLSALVIFFIQRQVIRPLAGIEQATKRIADGRFEPIEVGNTRDEIQKILLAFNKMAAELERRQDQLVQAQKLSAIGTLASGIAHQVNNPLNNISTSCQILLEEFSSGCSELALKMLTNIEKETFRARDIVRGLLEFSRNQEFVLTENRLLDVLERSLKLIASQVPPGIEIIQQVPDDISLRMDRQRMQELFLNLLLNAIHAISPKSGRIFISARQNLSENKVTIGVEDTGVGVPEAIRNRIFDPFFTTKAEGMGTGLGLYIVYNIVKQHKGEISLQNLMTGGSRFVIVLPIDLTQPGG